MDENQKENPVPITKEEDKGKPITHEQFHQLNSKLDRIIEILESIEFEDDEDYEDDEDEEYEEEEEEGEGGGEKEEDGIIRREGDEYEEDGDEGDPEEKKIREELKEDGLIDD